MNFLEEFEIEKINPGVYTGNAWCAQENKNELLDSFCPATNTIIASVNSCTSSDYEQVITHSQAVFHTWRIVPAPKRGEMIRLIAEALRRHKDALGSLISFETGKIKQEGDGEVQEMIDIADFSVGESRMLYGKTMHSERSEHRMYEQWHPLGIVGVITAFNFPVAVWAWNAFIAAIAGNTVVWKPSPKTPLCAIAVQKICNEVLEEYGYPGIFSLFVESGTDQVTKLISDARIPLVSFTGSSAVGRKVATAVAERLGKSLLELSGNNAVIIDESADLNLAIPAVVFGAIGTSGQRCTTTRRLFIHKNIYAQTVEKLVHIYQQIQIGDPLNTDVLMGPLIDQKAVTRFANAIETVRKAGGEILYGGEVLPNDGNYVMPTLARAQNHWEIVQQETFGPLLYVMPFNDFSEALVLQNSVPQGLSSSLFTNDVRHSEMFLSAIGSDCGIANINIGTSGAEIGGAFGGEKDTGGGREAGSDAWQVYMRRQTNTINWGDELPLAQGIKFELDQ